MEKTTLILLAAAIGLAAATQAHAEPQAGPEQRLPGAAVSAPHIIPVPRTDADWERFAALIDNPKRDDDCRGFTVHVHVNLRHISSRRLREAEERRVERLASAAAELSLRRRGLFRKTPDHADGTAVISDGHNFTVWITSAADYDGTGGVGTLQLFEWWVPFPGGGTAAAATFHEVETWPAAYEHDAGRAGGVADMWAAEYLRINAVACG